MSRDSIAERRRNPALLGLIVIALFLAIVIVGYVVSHGYEVLAEGRLLPYTGAQIAKVRFFDHFTVYVAKERPRPLDVLNAVLFAVMAGIAFFDLNLVLLHSVRDIGERGKAFLAIALVGSLYLAADELLGIHETIGHNLQFLMKLPGVHRPDDVILALYGIPALVVLVVFRDLIWSSKPVGVLFASGLALFVVAAAASDGSSAPAP